MSRIEEIFDGWRYYIWPTPEIKELAEKRIKICIECEYLNIFNVCSKCFCPCSGKAYSPESKCLDGRWGNINNSIN